MDRKTIKRLILNQYAQKPFERPIVILYYTVRAHLVIKVIYKSVLHFIIRLFMSLGNQIVSDLGQSQQSLQQV